MSNTYDCIVMGAGPAGSTVAALVAEAGLRVLLVERETMPRFHVGESLMPETYWTLERLGVLDQMKSSAHPIKRSVQFVSHTGKQSQPFYFQRHDPRESSNTWQVLRSEFDLMLYENAAAKGATCRDATRVLDVRMTGDRAHGVRLQCSGGDSEEVEARVVVDATGGQALMANRLGLRVDNPKLRKAAIWGYYENARRDEGDNSGATIILHTRDKKAWFWYIPLADNVTSIGVVADRDYLLSGRGAPEDVFAEELANCPAVVERLVDATLVSKFRVAKEFSYSTRRSAGDGWVMVGDAFGFIDPIYSSGVYFALRSGEMAADCIVEAIRSGDTSAGRLGSWTPEFLAATRWIAKLVDAFYTDAFSFGRFMKQHPQHVGPLTDLLIGRIFHPSAGKIFDDMEPWLERAQQESETIPPQ